MNKPTPLELLARRITPITDVVYGADHPDKKPRRQQPQGAASGGHYSLVQDVIPAETRQKLTALHGKLEAKQRRRGRKS